MINSVIAIALHFTLRLRLCCTESNRIERGMDYFSARIFGIRDVTLCVTRALLLVGIMIMLPPYSFL